MTYRLSFKGSAEKEFGHLPAEVLQRVAAAVDALKANPRPVGVESLAGPLRGLLRIRVGDYRVVYQVNDEARLITVTRIGHRSKVYH